MTSFRLKVQRFEQNCTFELSWGTGQQLSTTLLYPESISGLYQEWQRIYLSFYKSALRGRVEASGSIAPPPIDWHARLVQAEAKLLSEFHHWLRSAELFDIRAEIANSRLRKLRESMIVAGDSQPLTHPTINVFLTCHTAELEHLPWESWELGADFPTVGEIRIVRTPVNIRHETEPKNLQKRNKKTRILVILGDETGLNFQGDRAALRPLSRMAEIEFVGWQPGLDSTQLKANICRALADERGWDLLLFAGHSNETAITGGELAIAPNVSMSISEIAPQLIAAKKQGLKFALFNSCSGLSIANSLIDLGLSQVAVMREPIHNQVAHVFLVCFLQRLAEHKDVQESLLSACQYLRLEKSLTYPSAYLVPSLFCHPGAVFFHIPPYGTKAFLKRLIPTRMEVAAVTALILLSLSLSVQDWLLERRILMQAAYRNLTQQKSPAGPPPVLLVAIDNKSIIEAKINPPRPMNRNYLASLIDRLSAQGARVVGIDYLLDRPHGKSDQTLAKSLKAAATKQPHPTWFVFASVRDSTEGWLTVLPEIASPNWSLQGHINLMQWYVRLVPSEATPSTKLPLAYLLALAKRIHTESSSIPQNLEARNVESQDVPLPQLDSQTDFLSEAIRYLNREKKQDYKTIFSSRSQTHPLTLWSYHWGQMWLQPIIDFSIPPEQIYEHIPAWQLLKLPANSPQLKRLPQQVVLLAPGGYGEAGVLREGEDNFIVPPAIKYWLEKQGENSRRYFTGGEAHAYMIHHFLHQRLVIPIPDLWLVGLAVLAGKIIKAISERRRQQLAITLLVVTGVYGLLSLQLYLSSAILFPWVLPATTAGIYALPAALKLKRQKSTSFWQFSGSFLLKKDLR